MTGILATLGGGDAISGIVKTVGGVIDDLTTSDEERAAAELEFEKLDVQLATGQLEVNKEEAKHASMFVAGWRPAIGWVCAQALWFYYVPRAVMLTAVWAYGAFKTVAAWNGVGDMPALPAFPEMGIADILGLVGTMLGTATLRHRETMNDKARSDPLTPFKLPGVLKRKPAEVEAP